MKFTAIVASLAVAGAASAAAIPRDAVSSTLSTLTGPLAQLDSALSSVQSTVQNTASDVPVPAEVTSLLNGTAAFFSISRVGYTS